MENGVSGDVISGIFINVNIVIFYFLIKKKLLANDVNGKKERQANTVTVVKRIAITPQVLRIVILLLCNCDK